jgi:hypothetical protein
MRVTGGTPVPCPYREMLVKISITTVIVVILILFIIKIFKGEMVE